MVNSLRGMLPWLCSNSPAKPSGARASSPSAWRKRNRSAEIRLPRLWATITTESYPRPSIGSRYRTRYRNNETYRSTIFARGVASAGDVRRYVSTSRTAPSTGLEYFTRAARAPAASVALIKYATIEAVLLRRSDRSQAGREYKKYRGATKIALQIRNVTREVLSRPREIQLPNRKHWVFVELRGGSCSFRSGNLSVRMLGNAHQPNNKNPEAASAKRIGKPGVTLQASTPSR